MTSRRVEARFHGAAVTDARIGNPGWDPSQLQQFTVPRLPQLAGDAIFLGLPFLLPTDPQKASYVDL